jgi:hypothetical protein
VPPTTRKLSVGILRLIGLTRWTSSTLTHTWTVNAADQGFMARKHALKFLTDELRKLLNEVQLAAAP